MNIGLIDYARLEEFRLLALDNGIEIAESEVVNFVTDNIVYTAIDVDKLSGALIIGEDVMVIGDVNLEAYRVSIDDERIKL